MNDKFVFEINRNDNLIEFVRYVLSSRPSSVPKLSLPILDKNYHLSQLLEPNKLLLERYAKDNEKKKRFFNKCLQTAPLYPEKDNQKFIFKYSERRPERCLHEAIDKRRNLSCSKKEINSISSNSGLIYKSVTPLRERICLACRKKSLTGHQNQKKNKHSEKNQRYPLDHQKTTMQGNELSVTDELYQYLLNKNSKKLTNTNIIFEEKAKALDLLHKIEDNLEGSELFSKSFVKDVIKSPIKEVVHEMSFSINNTEKNSKFHSKYFKNSYLQLLNTNPINLKNDSLTSIYSIERLSI